MGGRGHKMVTTPLIVPQPPEAATYEYLDVCHVSTMMCAMTCACRSVLERGRREVELVKRREIEKGNVQYRHRIQALKQK